MRERRRNNSPQRTYSTIRALCNLTERPIRNVTQDLFFSRAHSPTCLPNPDHAISMSIPVSSLRVPDHWSRGQLWKYLSRHERDNRAYLPTVTERYRPVNRLCTYFWSFMTILLTGGTGKTSIPLAHRLSDQTAQTILLASRKGIKPETLSGSNHSNVHPVTFDWYDRTSWQNPFDYVTSKMLPQIDYIYLVAPFAWDVTMMNDFIDFAREKGVNKFVLLSASQAEAGDPSLGQVHGHLKRLSTEQGVQWVVIRPTWFIGIELINCVV